MDFVFSGVQQLAVGFGVGSGRAQQSDLDLAFSSTFSQEPDDFGPGWAWDRFGLGLSQQPSFVDLVAQQMRGAASPWTAKPTVANQDPIILPRLPIVKSRFDEDAKTSFLRTLSFFKGQSFLRKFLERLVRTATPTNEEPTKELRCKRTNPAET